jgi:hypothetical protein
LSALILNLKGTFMMFAQSLRLPLLIVSFSLGAWAHAQEVAKPASPSVAVQVINWIKSLSGAQLAGYQQARERALQVVAQAERGKSFATMLCWGAKAALLLELEGLLCVDFVPTLNHPYPSAYLVGFGLPISGVGATLGQYVLLYSNNDNGDLSGSYTDAGGLALAYKLGGEVLTAAKPNGSVLFIFGAVVGYSGNIRGGPDTELKVSRIF